VDAPETPSDNAHASRSRRWTRGLAVVALGAAVGIAVAVGPRAFDTASGADAGRTPSGAVPLGSLSTRQVADATAAAGADLAAAPVPDAPAAPAPSARAAIEGFLAAEVAEQYDASYGFLSASDRSRVGGRAEWLSNHANLPAIARFTVESVVESADEASVVTTTDLRASLDEIIGLVPAHARGIWITVREDGGWRVAYTRSRLEPQYPDPSLATTAAREWVTARQECRVAAEWSGGVLGPDAIAKRICRAPGPVTVGAAAELFDDAGIEAVTAAFGPDVYAWARVVPVTAPARLDLVLAPVGERWLVIGIRKASPGTR
jgi:hypothetical protein